MSHRMITVMGDREFRLPSGCLQAGEVECQVVRSDCVVISICDDLLAFKVVLVLRITIRAGGLRCSFTREVVLHDCCWLDGHHLFGCEVIRAVCRCRLRRGKVRCAIVAEVRLFLRGGHGCECCCELVAEEEDGSGDDLSGSGSGGSSGSVGSSESATGSHSRRLGKHKWRISRSRGSD